MVFDAAADLFLGGACLGCDRPGRALCRQCRAALEPAPEWVKRKGLDLSVAAGGTYDGVLKRIIPAHKDGQALQLAAPLGAMLAPAISLHLPDAGVVLVPMPSPLRAVRERGYDHSSAITKAANRWLRPQLHVMKLLRVSAHTDQSALSAAARAANLQGRMVAQPGQLRVLICDDVVTTGASLAEAVRALRAAGHTVLGAAVVADTPRRDPMPG